MGSRGRARGASPAGEDGVASEEKYVAARASRAAQPESAQGMSAVDVREEAEMLRRARRRRVQGDRGRPSLVGALALVMLVCAGCGSDAEGNAALKVAEARGAANEKDLAEAKADLASKSAEFCDTSQTYITALDRYGDVLSQTSPTVGDVKDAGSDLERPREDALADAEEAVTAQQKVVEATQELAGGMVALAAAKAPGSAAPSTPASTTSPKPLAPEATV